MKSKLFITLTLIACINLCGLANNIQVSNVSFTLQNTTLHTVQVQFTLSWENSWRVTAGPGNWDAAWVFVKYRVGGGPWLHASLNNTNFVAPTGSTIAIGLLTPGTPFNATVNPGVGAFVYRNANGSGTFTVNSAQLQWNYGANGLGDNEVVDMQVFAIEQVYVPQGAFYVGDGSAPSGYEPLNLTTINTANATIVSPGYGQAGGCPAGQIPPTNASWPNGYNAFYCMKYEVSQQGYVDFLNTLTRYQQAPHVTTNINGGVTSVTNRYVMTGSTVLSGRNGIRCDATISALGAVPFYCDFDGDGIGGETTDGKDIACMLSMSDLFAYLDWAALRPLSELEYEKCGRGTLPYQVNEYAWGNTNITPATSILNAGLSSEKPNTNANVSCMPVSGSNPGVLRVGSFAGLGTNREQAGAGYYGVMELTGNLFERVISLATVDDRAYIGSHGNGVLDGSGSHTNSDWRSELGSTYYNLRGGSIANSAAEITLSARSYSPSFSPGRYFYLGGRGCRTAP